MFRDDTKQVRSRLPRVHVVRFNDVSDIAYLQDELIFITSCGLPLFSKSEVSAVINEVSLQRITCTLSTCMNVTVFSSVYLHIPYKPHSALMTLVA